MRAARIQATLCALHAPISILRHAAVLPVCIGVVLTIGCIAGPQWVKVRDTPRNPLAGSLDLLSRNGPKPTDRTMQLLRRYDLHDELSGDRAMLIRHAGGNTTSRARS